MRYKMQAQRTDNGNYLISDGEKCVELSQDNAIKLAKIIFETAKDDYRTLKPGDHVWYVDEDELFIEEGIVTTVTRNNVDFSVVSFGVEFPESKDFDEFYGSALGDCFFLSKELAEYHMNYKNKESHD